MPKLVDHAQKRSEIIRATWRLVATRGFEAATMREIAAESGHANGALSHYFSNKEELLRAAYMFVWEETNTRIAERLGTSHGLDAVRIYWEEISPSTDVTQLEAKIVLPFFARAATDPALAEITATTMDQWRDEIAVHLDRARSDGELVAAVPTGVIVEQLMNMLLGLQILAMLAPTVENSRNQQSMFEEYLRLLSVDGWSTDRKGKHVTAFRPKI